MKEMKTLERRIDEKGCEKRREERVCWAPVISPLHSLAHEWAEKLEIRSCSSQVEWRRMRALFSGGICETSLSGRNNKASPSHPPERPDQPHQLSEGNAAVNKS